MKYLEFTPGQDLSPYVQLIWIMEAETPGEVCPREKILPDGIVEIVFHYREPFITYYQDGRKLKQPMGFAVSQMRKYIEIESDGPVGFVSVRLYPWGGHHFFEHPVKDFLDDTIDLERFGMFQK